VTPECRDVLTEWLAAQSGSRAHEIHSLYGKRTTVSVLRNACAFARLLMRPTVDAECARLSVWLLEQSIESLNITSLGQLNRPSSKSAVAISVMQMLNSKHANGWTRHELATALCQYPRHFISPYQAKGYIDANFARVLWNRGGDLWTYRPEDSE